MIAKKTILIMSDLRVSSLQSSLQECKLSASAANGFVCRFVCNCIGSTWQLQTKTHWLLAV